MDRPRLREHEGLGSSVWRARPYPRVGVDTAHVGEGPAGTAQPVGPLPPHLHG